MFVEQPTDRGSPELNLRLNPILDASHTRNRNTSPPDSECFPGTRQGVIRAITNWGDNMGSFQYEEDIPHIYWLHGFAGCGKSAVFLEVARIYARSGRLLASYFFFRGAGDRSTMNRFAPTLASQLMAAIPATAPLVEAAVKAEPGVVTDDASLATQLDLLILSP